MSTILLSHPFWSWVLVRINQDSVAERSASIIDPEPLIHNYCSLTSNGLVLYEEVNGAASHIRLNYLWKCWRVLVSSMVCVIKRNVLSLGENMWKRDYCCDSFHFIFKTYNVYAVLIYFPCTITWSPSDSFLLIMLYIKAKNDQN